MTKTQDAESTTIAALLETFYSTIEELADECEESRSNMEEKFSATERYERLQTATSTLESIRDDKFEPDFDGPFEDKEALFTPPKALPKKASRADRVAWALEYGREARERLENMLTPDGGVQIDDLMPDTLRGMADKAEEIETGTGTLEQQLDEAEGIEW